MQALTTNKAIAIQFRPPDLDCPRLRVTIKEQMTIICSPLSVVYLRGGGKMWTVILNGFVSVMWFVIAIFETDKVISRLDMIVAILFYFMAYLAWKDETT
jgi:hypothetical protein